MGSFALIGTCPVCKIPTSSHGQLRWCLYCTFAADRAGLLQRIRLVRTVKGTEREICISQYPRHAVAFFSGDMEDCPSKYRIDGCDLFLSSRTTTDPIKVVIEMFIPKEG